MEPGPARAPGAFRNIKGNGFDDSILANMGLW